MASRESPTLCSPESPGDAAPTTDFALIESQKENIRPLAGGRSAATLGALFDKDKSEEAQRIVAEGTDKFIKDIEEAERRDREGEDMVDGVQDVLDLYNRYIAFTIQHYPSSPGHVLPLLESTTRRFIDDARYAQDARYLKLWVMYSRHVERREEVWAFLESRDIGTRHASFYEEWAMTCEGLGRKKKADDVYRLGVHRRAAPLERLKNRHQAFLARIMAPPSGVVPDDDPVPAAAPRGSRSVLGVVGGAVTPARGSTLSGAAPVASSSRVSKGHNGSKIEIFSDSTGQPAEPESTPWDDFGTRDGRRKENTVDPTPWAGEKLPQNSARNRVAPRTPKLEVFKDAATENASTRPAEEVLGGIRAKQPLSEAELLRSDPLRHYNTSGVSSGVPSLPPPPSSAKKPPAKRSKREHRVMEPWVCPTGGRDTKTATGKTERRMFDWDATFRGGEEWSFEEIRARKLGLLGKDWKELKAWEQQWHKPGSTTPKAKKVARPPSPTVNTKLANAEVMSLFNQTIHGGKIRDDSDSDDSDDDGDEAEDEVQPLPTPLPRHTRQPVAMMTPGGMVPPTPTPAPGHAQRQIMPQTPNIFADENASAPSARKMAIFCDENAPTNGDENAPTHGDENAPVHADENAPPTSTRKFNIFSDTPAKSLGSSRTPLTASTKRAFGSIRESAQPSETELVQATPARRALGNVFATPHVDAHETIPEESEARESENEPENIQGGAFDENAPATRHDSTYDENSHIPSAQNVYGQLHPEQDQENEDYDDYYQSYGRPMRHFQIHEMTPITERTCEYTSMTARSSRRSTVFSDIDEDEPMLPQPAHRESLGSVAEEDERVRSNRTSPQPDRSRGEVRAALERVASLSPRDNDRQQQGVVVTDPSVPEVAPGAEVDTATKMMDTMAVDDASPSANDVDLPNPCNPGDDKVIATLLERIRPPLESMANFVDHRPGFSARLPALQKVAKARARRSISTSRSSIAPSDEAYQLELGGTRYEVKDKLGEGGFGAVFLGVDTSVRDVGMDGDGDEDEDDDEQTNALVAIKVEHPGSLWEAVMLDRVHARLTPEVLESIIHPRGLHLYANESFLLLEYSAQGTLLDVVNKAVNWGIAPAVSGPSVPEELLAIFFAIELLKLVEVLHANNIIHGDLKIDNCLVRLSPLSPSDWSQQYDRTGRGGWSAKGVKLIDFGRAADLTLFPAGARQTFVADWKTDERDCIEMREGRTWSFETDYFGLASICYCMLFGKYIGTEVVDGRVRIDMALKRYWQTALWSKLFDALLNPRTLRAGDLPVTSELAAIRSEFEDYLEENCSKNGKQLRQMLKRIELRAMERR